MTDVNISRERIENCVEWVEPVVMDIVLALRDRVDELEKEVSRQCDAPQRELTDLKRQISDLCDD